MALSPVLRVACCIFGIAASVAIAPAPARAQGKLDARYAITFAGLSIGQAEWSVTIGPERYSIAAKGGASGWLRVLVSGHGEATVQGAMKDGRPVPETFTAKLVSDDDTSDVKMTLDKNAVKELTAAASEAKPDRIPITEAHRKDIIDPLSAMIIPIGGSTDVINPGKTLSDEACVPRLPVFDGRRRFDLKLAFKRVDKVKADRGYSGPVVVCALTFQPIAGHRASSSLMKYLSEGRDMELWLAPIAGTHLAAPFRLTVANLIGSMTVNAERFETVSTATERASIVIGPGGGPKLKRSPGN